MKEMNNNFLRTITKEQIEELPYGHFEGKIILIDNPSQFNNILPIINGTKCLGFDTETKPTFKKGRKNSVALLQLSTEHHAILIRTQKVGLPDEVLEIFQNPEIQKVGVAIKDDLLALQKLNYFNPEGFVDLQQYVKQFNIDDNGLKKLAANILNIRISKSQQTSNWEVNELTENQQIYAATDAWVCHEIFNKLNNH
jgi:ribonuclease D